MLAARAGRVLARFAAAASGNVAMIFALAMPPLCVAAVGGVQLSYVMTVKSAAQDVADSAALAGAEQMSLGPVGAAQRAQSWAQAQLAAKNLSTSTFTVTAKQLDGATLKVAIDTYTPSFFGDMLPVGGFRSHVEAVAEQQGEAPLCVLIDGTSGDQLHVQDKSQLSGSCLVHGNGDVVVDPAAAITATRVEAGGNANGPINPTPAQDVAKVSDPFANLNFAPPQTCAPTHKTVPGALTILPGVHQEDISIPNGTPVVLLPGNYYFCGSVDVGNGATITGSNVLLVFDVNAALTAKPNASIQVSGLQSGTLAGFVLAVNGTSSNYKLPVDPFDKITGAIYAPNTTLELNGSKNGAASASDWTVVAAKALKVSGGANLQINTNYSGSQVYVPIGVGNNHQAVGGGAVHLSH